MSETHLTPDLELDGLSPDEAFAVLGNEIRLDIIRVLWQADASYQYDEVSDSTETMSFSELRRQTDIVDNGQFNYHLSQLSPHFVRQTDDGYRLSGAGKQIARTVIAVSGTENLEFSADLAQTCPLCEAPMKATYEDQWLRVSCTECEGQFGDETPHGAIFLSNYPATTMAEQTPDEALQTGFYRCMLDNAYLMHGICRECAGAVSTSVSVCEGHHPRAGDPCPDCGTRSQVWAEQRCETCRFAKHLPVEVFVMGLTPIIGFLDQQGIDVLAPSLEEIVDVLQHKIETAVTTAPLRVTVTVANGSDELTVTLDEELNLVDLDR